MQEFLLIISRFISTKKSCNDVTGYNRFHFRGYYAGEKINGIHLFQQVENDTFREFNKSLSKGDDYLLWVKKRKVVKEVLEVELIKFKKIN